MICSTDKSCGHEWSHASSYKTGLFALPTSAVCQGVPLRFVIMIWTWLSALRRSLAQIERRDNPLYSSLLLRLVHQPSPCTEADRSLCYGEL